MNAFFHFSISPFPRLLTPFFVLLALLRTSPISAQQNFQWRNFTRIGDGLSSNNVRSIAEDQLGQIWLATDMGMSRFDGFWDEVDVPTGGTQGNDVSQILKDLEGFTWIATNAGVYRGIWNASLNRIDWLQQYTQETALIDNRISTIMQRGNGEIWIGTPLGVNWFDGETWHPVVGLEQGQLDQGVQVIYEDMAGTLWFGLLQKTRIQTGNLLSRFDGGVWEIFSADEVLNGDVQAISEDGFGNLWVGTNAGVAVYDGSTWHVVTAQDGLLLGNSVTAIMNDGDGIIWVGTTAGISQFRMPRQFSPTDLAAPGRWSHLTKANGLASNNIQALFESQGGEIWVGTRDNGASFSNRSWKSVTTDNGLGDDSVTAVLTDGQGDLWVGTRDGLSRYTTDGIEFVIGPPGNEIRALAEDLQGGLWVGTNMGVSTFDGDSWRTFQIPDINVNSVHSMVVDSGGNTWVGTGFLPTDELPGLDRYDGVQWHSRQLPEISRTIVAMFVDSRERLYIATVGNDEGGSDLWVSDGVSLNRIYRLPEQLSIRVMLEAPGGEIWVGTDAGIQVLDGETLNLTALLTTSDGLVDNRVQALYRDQRDRIWIGTVDGVSLFQSGQFERTLTASDGLNSNNISVITEADGALWFGSRDNGGISRFNQEMTPPRTRMTDGPTNGEIVGDTSVVFKFEGGDASTLTQELRYTYQLDGGLSIATDDGGFDERVLLSSLVEGAHRFTVRAIDKEGNADGAGAVALFWVDSSPPRVSISDPKRGAVIGGIYSITGTATDETDFQDYQIQIFPGDQGSGVLVLETLRFTEAVEDTLYAWDTGAVSDGTYTIRLFARDTKNGDFDRQHSSDTTVTIEADNTRPLAKILLPLPGATLSEKVDVEVELADAHLSRYLLAYSRSPNAVDEDWAAIRGEAIGESSIVTVGWNTSALDGQIFLRATAEDAANNSGTSASIPYRLDNAAARPVVAILAPNEAETVSGEVRILGTVNVGIAPNAVIGNVLLEYRAAEGSPEAWKEIGSRQGRFNDEEIARWNTSELPDGAYQLSLTAIDSNSYTSATQRTLILDNTRPQPIIASPKDGDVLRTGSIAVIGTATDQHFSRYELQFSQVFPSEISPGETGGASGHIPPLTNAPVENGRLGDWNATELPGGEYTLRLTVFDLAGLEASAEVNVIFDDAEVIAQISSPKRDGFVSSTVQIIGTVRDENFNRYGIKVRSVGQVGEWQSIDVFSPDQPKTNEPLATWNTPQLDGIYEIRLTASDRADKRTEDLVRVFVDNVAPQAKISVVRPLLNAPSQGEEPPLTLSGTVEIIGTVDDVHFKDHKLEFRALTGDRLELIPLENSTQPKIDAVLAIWDTPEVEGEYEILLSVSDLSGKSKIDRVRVTVDNQPPQVQISHPTEGQLVSGEIEIRGTVDDAHLASCRLEFRPVNDSRWQEIGTFRIPKRAQALAKWEPPETDGPYEIHLTASDRSGRAPAVARVTVIVDKLPPHAEILSPTENQQLMQRIEIRGTANDQNFKEYIIEYGVGESPDAWLPISKPPAFLSAVTRDTLASWDAPNLSGQHALRLRVRDWAGHEELVQVHVFFSPEVDGENGGTVQSQDNLAKIVFPPNSLPERTIATINPILNGSAKDSPSAVEASVGRAGSEPANHVPRFGLDYEFAPMALKLHRLKPATIEFSIGDPETLFLHTRGDEILTIARWNGEVWQSIGGTIDRRRRTISTAVSRLGRYAATAMPAVETVDDTEISNLTCQPRVFSPNRGESTAISFQLNRAGSITIKIYNEAGRLRRTLKDSEHLSAGRHVFWWAGRDDDNRRVVSSFYIVTVEGESTQGTKTVIVQNIQ